MYYDHSNSDFEGGDSMSQPTSDRKSSAKDYRSKKESTGSACQLKLHRCSYCGKTFEKTESKHMPFCSKQCQAIDLGMWLNEGYGIPIESDTSTESFDEPFDNQDG